MAKATRDGGGGGSERGQRSALEKEKKKKRRTRRLQRRATRYERKGRGVVKKKRDNPPRGLPARGGSSVPVERKDGQREREKNAHASLLGGRSGVSTVCDVANVALFGNVPTVDFVTRGNSKLCPTPAPQVPLTSLPLVMRHAAAPSLSRHASRRVFSLDSLLDAPSSLPTFWDTPPLPFGSFFFLLVFSLLPLTISLLLAGI